MSKMEIAKTNRQTARKKKYLYLRSILAALLIILAFANCIITRITYQNAFPEADRVQISISEIEKIYLDSNDFIKVRIKEQSDCLKIRDGSYHIHFRPDFKDYHCKAFRSVGSRVGIPTLSEISNSAILRNDKVILDFSDFPKDKFVLINPYVVWGVSDKSFQGYVYEPKIDNEFKNVYISNDYQYLFIEKKGKIFVFDSHNEKKVLRRIVDENSSNKIISYYKDKLSPIQFIRIDEKGILSITERQKRIFFELTNSSKLYDVTLELSKDKDREIYFRYIPLLPFSLIVDIITGPLQYAWMWLNRF
jgi:hypothetical protein